MAKECPDMTELFARIDARKEQQVVENNRPVITVKKSPAWVQSGDPIIQRNDRIYIRSLTQTEPRWRHHARKLVLRLRSWRDRT